MCSSDLGWDVFHDDGRDGGEAAFTHTTELMNPHESAEDREILHLHVAGEGRVVGEDRVVAHDAVVGDMAVGHHPVVITHPRDATTPYSTPVDADVFAQGVAVADLEPHRHRRVKFLVLRVLADGTEGVNLVVQTDARRSLKHAVGPDDAAGADLHALADAGPGSYDNIGRKSGAGMEDRKSTV